MGPHLFTNGESEARGHKFLKRTGGGGTEGEMERGGEGRNRDCAASTIV